MSKPDRRTELKEGADDVVRSALSPGETMRPEDVGSLSRLVAVGAGAGGDPKEALRMIPDSIVDSLYDKIDGLVGNPMIGNVVRLIALEWSFRHGFLKEDWIWRPDADGGTASYRSSVPTDDLLRPLSAFVSGGSGSTDS